MVTLRNFLVHDLSRWHNVLLMGGMLIVIVETCVGIQALVDWLFHHRLFARSYIRLVLRLRPRLELMLESMNFWSNFIILLLGQKLGL